MDKNTRLSNNDYFVKEFRYLRDLEGFKSVWDNLASKQDIWMPFLCFDWFDIWLQNFIENRRLLILLLFKGDRVAAVAPFVMGQDKQKGVSIRKIELIGNVYSPFRSFIFDESADDQKEKSVYYILEYLSKRNKGWDVIEFSAVPEEKKCFDILKSSIRKSGLKHTQTLSYGDWYLDEISCTGDDYVAKLPKKIVKDIQYCRRRLEKSGQCEFKVITGNDLVDHYMDLYYGVYAKSWQKQEAIGPNFHRDLAKLCGPKGWLRLGFLFFNGLPIASQFWITSNGASYILKTVYDQDYKQHSPGKILTSLMMKYAIDEDGVKVVDYVQGDEDYKKDWTPKRRERKGLLVFNKTIKGEYLALLANKIQPLFQKYKTLKDTKEFIKTHLGRCSK